jgi:lipopolysaccharide transport system permease protein
MQEINNWTLVIKPRRNWLDIDFKGIWQYRDLVVLFVRRDFVSKYKQTILGPLWFIINPLFSTILFSVVFNGIAKIPTDGTPPMLFNMAGITAWNYFAACLNGTSNTFVANAGIFGKVYFPRLVTPISIVISTLIQFGIQFGLFIVMMLVYYFQGYTINLNMYALWIPYLVILMALMGLGFGIIISALTTKYRDLVNLMTFAVQLWMYGSAVIYPLSVVPEKYRLFIMLNPETTIIETFKYGLIGAGSFNMGMIIYSTIFTIVSLFIGILIFNKVEQGFMDTV